MDCGTATLRTACSRTLRARSAVSGAAVDSGGDASDASEDREERRLASAAGDTCSHHCYKQKRQKQNPFALEVSLTAPGPLDKNQICTRKHTRTTRIVVLLTNTRGAVHACDTEMALQRVMHGMLEAHRAAYCMACVGRVRGIEVVGIIKFIPERWLTVHDSSAPPPQPPCQSISCMHVC